MPPSPCIVLLLYPWFFLPLSLSKGYDLQLTIPPFSSRGSCTDENVDFKLLAGDARVHSLVAVVVVASLAQLLAKVVNRTITLNRRKPTETRKLRPHYLRSNALSTPPKSERTRLTCPQFPALNVLSGFTPERDVSFLKIPKDTPFANLCFCLGIYQIGPSKRRFFWVCN